MAHEFYNFTIFIKTYLCFYSLIIIITKNKILTYSNLLDVFRRLLRHLPFFIQVIQVIIQIVQIIQIIPSFNILSPLRLPLQLKKIKISKFDFIKKLENFGTSVSKIRSFLN